MFPGFKIARGSFRSKPADRFDADGLPLLAVCPTPVDAAWNFRDSACVDDDELLDMMHDESDKRRASDRLAQCLGGLRFDSCEIGQQCFGDGRWPLKTDVSCWWCLHPFDSRPFPCPIRRDRAGKWVVRGVFCGPSCAKAWAAQESRFLQAQHIDYLIDVLARLRGFCPPGKKWLHIPTAPPRNVLKMFRGSEGMTISQFRKLCACSFEVKLLEPPVITQKQVIIAEFSRLEDIAKKGRICHREMDADASASTTEIAQRRREGLEVFAGIGARKLNEFFGPSRAGHPPVPVRAAAAPPARAAVPAPPPPAASATAPAKQKQPPRPKRPLPPTKLAPSAPAQKKSKH
jgi:hypothetical protein